MFTRHPVRACFLAACLLVGAVVPGGSAMATEEPAFTVVRQTDTFEVRSYAPLIVAETVVEGDWSDASSQGFRRLAGYIFGGNKQRAKIAMTAPVGTQEGAKIARVSPDTVRQEGSRSWVVSFTMPARWTLARLPQPDDPRVRLREIPMRRVAAKRVGGWWSAANFAEDSDIFLRDVATAGLKVGANRPVMARYNPPWTPFFLRRNELLVELSEGPDAPAAAERGAGAAR